MTDDDARTVVLMLEDIVDNADAARAICRATNTVSSTHRFTIVRKADLARGWYVAVEVLGDRGEQEISRDCS
jgi:hypothetical protein